MDGICRECGCTDERACLGGCWWVEPDLCSACVLGRLESGDHHFLEMRYFMMDDEENIFINALLTIPPPVPFMEINLDMP